MSHDSEHSPNSSHLAGSRHRPLPAWPPAHARIANDAPPPRHDRGRLWRAFWPVLLFTLLLWWLHFLAAAFGWDLWGLGVRPGNPTGLLGVLTAPLIHGSWEHLVANTPSVLVLGTLLLYSYPRAARWVIPAVWIGSGLGVWIFGEAGSVHVGASGLTHGLMFYLFVTGILRAEPRAMAIAMAVFFLYGGMILTIFPREPDVSWEAHMFGAIPGLILAFLLFRLDARQPRKVYSWERETEEEEDPVIGDLWKFRRPPPPEALEDTEETPLHGDDDDHRW